MRRSIFSDAQSRGLLQEPQAALSAAELGRKRGFSDATFFSWRSKYGGMEASEASRLKPLEDDDAKLQRLLAEPMTGVSTLRERPGARRSALTWAMTGKTCSQRRVCRLVGLDPRVHRHRSKRPDDAGLRARLRALAAERRRLGRRRRRLLVERKGITVNWKKLCRPH